MKKLLHYLGFGTGQVRPDSVSLASRIRVLGLVLVLLATFGVGNAWGGETTYTFTSKSWTATSGGSAANWTSGQDGGGFSNNGIQVTTSSTGANGTSPVSFTNVTKVVCTYNTNKSAGAGTIDVQVGSNDAKSVEWGFSGTADGRSANFTATVNYTTAETGNVKITLNTTTNSIYLVSVTITTSDGGGQGGQGGGGSGSGSEESGDGTITFGTNDVKINAASVTGDDSREKTWTITTVGTTSFTTNAAYYQVGSGSSPATSITFTTTLSEDMDVTAFSAKFGGFSGTAGTVTLKVGNTTVGTGSLSGTSDVVVENSSTATGTVLTVTVTGISKGVKAYYISYTVAKPGASATCVIPVFDPAEGSVESGTQVTITTETEGATIYYTMGENPDDPDENADEYTSAITLTESTTIKAIAIKEGLNNSAVATATYIIAAALTDDEFAWNAASYQATIGGENSFPILTNTHDLSVTYQSTNTAAATIAANGTITLVKAGTTTIMAIFEGNNNYVAKTVTYELTVAKAADSNTSKTIDLTKDETDVASADQLQWNGTYVTTTVVKGENGTAANNYCPPTRTSTRFYSGSTLTFAPVSGYKITSIVFTAASNGYASALQSSEWTNATASMEEGTEVKEVTVTAEGAGNVSAAIGATCGFEKIVINYGLNVPYAVEFATPTGGTLAIKDGETPIISGAEFSQGKKLNVEIAADSENHYIGGAVVVKKTSDNSDVTSTVYNAGTGKLTVPAYGITVSATFTPTYAIELVADGGSIALDYTAGDAPAGRAIAGTEIMATATADGSHTFSGLALSDNVTVKEIDGNVATFTMPEGNVTVTATFAAKQVPSISVKDNVSALNFGSVAKDSEPVAQTFKISGLNLAEGTLAITSLDEDHFTVSPTSINVNGTLAETTITVTPVTSVVGGPFEGGVVISGGGLAQADEVTIEFSLTVLQTYTAKWIVNGNTETPYASQTAVASTALNIPSNPEATGSCAGLVFQGWVDEAISGTATTAPTYVNTENLTMPAEDVTYYAVFAEEEEANSGSESLTESEITSQFASASHKYTDAAVSYGDNDVTWYAVYSVDAQNRPWMQFNNTSYVKITAPEKITSVVAVVTSSSNQSGGIADKTKYNPFGSAITLSLKPSTTGDAVASASTNTTDSYQEITLNVASGNNTELYLMASGAYRLWSLTVNYGGDASYTNFVTTCVACSRVTLNAAEVEHGSIKLQQDSKDVASVKTCDAAQTVNVVATPADGYELTGVELSGTAAAKASYENGVISIQKEAEGALTATASFALVDYAITYTAPTNGSYTIKVGDADAVSEATVANIGQTITLAAEAAEGYLFTGWTVIKTASSAAVTVTNNAFTMPNEAVTVAANFVRLYSVADFIAIQDKGTAEYCIEGIVSNVKSLDPTKYTNAQYYISADGQRESEVYIYNGKYLNGADFTSTSQLAEGDKVIVCGTWDGNNSRVNAANYLISRVEGEHASYEIVGDLGKSNFMDGEQWLNSYLNGLSVNDVYNTGYKVEVEGVQFSADKEDEATLSTEDTKITVTATKNEATLVEKDFTITVSAATLVSFVLKEGYKTEYYVGETFVKPTVIATLSDNSQIEEVATACTGYNMDAAGEYTVSVSFTYGDITLDGENGAEYQITVKAVFNNEDAPHTVAKAIELIQASAYQSTTSSTDYMWVSGKVVSAPNNSGTYTISDDGTASNALTVWAGKYFDSSVSAKGNVAQGDAVVLKGTVVNYNGNQAELTSSTVISQLREAQLSITDVEGFEVGSADLNVTVTTASDGDITFTSGDVSVVTIVDGKLHAVAAGTATITANLAATENDGALNYTAASTTFSVTVIAAKPRYAVTFAMDGGSPTPSLDDQLENANVVIPAGIYTKANSAFDGWTVTRDDNQATVAVTENDGVYSFTMPATAVTVTAQWNTVASCVISFRVSGQEVATAYAPQTAPFALTEEGPEVSGFTFLGWSETEYDEETTTMPTLITSYTPEVDEAAKVLYGIYSQVQSGENKHYVLDYADEGLANNTNWGAYSTAYDYTAADGGAWTIKAYKQQGMQINVNNNNPHIKVPNCSAKIIQISLTCNTGAKNAVKFAETIDGESLANGTANTTQTLDLSSANVTTGYILPTGNCQITNIDVEYSGNVTYYTSTPATRYQVTYLKGEATNVTGLCEAKRLVAGEITLCDAPTSTDKNFVKWFDGTNLYAAGANYTLAAEVTFTATWEPKAKFTVTYNANGGVGTAPEAVEYMEGATVTVPAENNLFTNPGFVFDSWKVFNQSTNAEIPVVNGEFTMPANNVIIKATWAEPSNQKWALVTETSQLVAGDKYVIAAADADYALSTAQETNYRGQTVVTKRDNGQYLMGTSSMQVITLAGSAGAWEFNTGSGYLYAAGSGKGNNYLKTQETNDANGQWTIVITGGVASITANGTNTNNQLKYNSGSTRFSCYSSGQGDVALYKEIPLTVITTESNDKTQDAVADGGDLTLGENVIWTVTENKEVGDVHMEEGAIIDNVIDENNSATVTANDLYFKAKKGKSNQVMDANNLEVTGDFYYDFQLCDGDLDPDYWYSIAVPFNVNLNEGVFKLDGTQLAYGTDYEVWEYDTQKRAQTMSNGWKRVTSGKMVAGKAYLIGFNPGMPNTIRLKAAEGWKNHLFDETSGEMEMQSSATTNPGDHDNWNGIANPTMHYFSVGEDDNIQVFDNNTHSFSGFAYNVYTFVVGTAFFVQRAEALPISNDDHGTYRAPKREEDKLMYSLRITREGAADFDNQIILRASEDATNEYEQGHDMLSMNNATSKTAALLWTENYGGKRLAVEEAQIVNNKASYTLGIYAPAAGNYTISVPTEREDATVYLTKNGNIIWNLSMSEYTGSFEKGNNAGYGIRIVRAPQVGTGVENTSAAEAGVQKVIIDEHVYILRGEQLFDVNGKMVK